MRPPSCLSDLPIPPPPPMTNLFVTSRFDLHGLGGYGFRRTLSSDVMMGLSAASPYLARKKSLLAAGLSRCSSGELLSKPSKYLADSDLSKEMEEVEALTKEIMSKYSSLNEYSMKESDSGLVEEEQLPSPKEMVSRYVSTTPEAFPSSTYCQDHYISDIDENEEVKRFFVSYEARSVSATSSFSPLPRNSMASFQGVVQGGEEYRESWSSVKSSDCGSSSPLTGRRDELAHSEVWKSPSRPVVKLARIR